jgi:hypothetical protein
MTAELIFSIANVLSVLCWILLAVLPNRRWVTDVVTGKAAFRPDGMDHLHPREDAVRAVATACVTAVAPHFPVVESFPTSPRRDA